MKCSLSAVLLFLLAACAEEGARPQNAPSRGPLVTTLEVVNDGIDPYTIRVDGVSIGWVQPGRSACLRIPHSYVHRRVKLTAEHQRGSVAFESEFAAEGRAGWQWKLGVLGNVGTFPIWREKPCLVGGKLGYADWPQGEAGAWGWVRIDVIASEEAVATIAHEASHMEDANLYGRDVWLGALNDRERWAAMEAKAFCASARAAHAEGRFSDLERAMWHYARWLAEGYPQFQLSQADAAREIRHFCMA